MPGLRSASNITALFVGGPLDGEYRELAPSPSFHVYELPDGVAKSVLWPQASQPPEHLLPYIRTYDRVSRTPEGVTIYELIPLPEHVTHLTVRVVTEKLPDKDKMARELQYLLDREALPEVKSQRVTISPES